MILPTKYIPLSDSILGVGAIILSKLGEPATPSAIWEEVRDTPEVGNYERFILALDLLFAIQAVERVRGLIQKRTIR